MTSRGTHCKRHLKRELPCIHIVAYRFVYTECDHGKYDVHDVSHTATMASYKSCPSIDE